MEVCSLVLMALKSIPSSSQLSCCGSGGGRHRHDIPVLLGKQMKKKMITSVQPDEADEMVD